MDNEYTNEELENIVWDLAYNKKITHQYKLWEKVNFDGDTTCLHTKPAFECVTKEEIAQHQKESKIIMDKLLKLEGDLYREGYGIFTVEECLDFIPVEDIYDISINNEIIKIGVYLGPDDLEEYPEDIDFDGYDCYLRVDHERAFWLEEKYAFLDKDDTPIKINFDKLYNYLKI